MSKVQDVLCSPRRKTVSHPTELPNVTGDPSPTDKLEKGDTCYVDSDFSAPWATGLYMCKDPTPGFAVWKKISGPAFQPGVDFRRSSASTYYSSTAPELKGTNDFTFAALLRLHKDFTGQIVGAGNPEALGEGWALDHNSGQLRFSVADGAGTMVNIDVNTDFLTYWGAANYRYTRESLIMGSAEQNGGVTRIKLFINGAMVGQADAANANVTPATTDFFVGDPGSGEAQFAVRGVAFRSTFGALDIDGVADYFNHCVYMEALADQVTGFNPDFHWVAREYPTGDGEVFRSIAGGDLLAIGAENTIVQIPYRWG